MIEEFSSKITVSGSSGATCGASAPYSCSTHTDTVLWVRKGAKFPNCPVSKSKKGHTTTWYTTSETTPPPSSVDQLDSVAL
jgi:hypothetical protein